MHATTVLIVRLSCLLGFVLTGSLTAGEVGIDARFIRVIKTDGTINPADLNRLHIGEIEVFPFGAAPLTNAVDNASDLALATNGASAVTVSGGNQHGADAALVDGVVNTGGATWSRQNPLPIIAQVDLGGTFQVGQVRVWQRGDSCCQTRLAGFSLELLEDNGGVPGNVVFTESFPGQAPLNSYASFETTSSTGIVWTGAADNLNWDVAGNWDLNRVPTTNDLAIFEGTVTGAVVSLNGTQTVAEVVFQRAAADFELSGGVLVADRISHNTIGTNVMGVALAPTNALAINTALNGLLFLNGAVQNDLGLDISAFGPIDFTGVISGGGVIAKKGGGIVEFSNGGNDFTGLCRVELGTLLIGVDGALGDVSGATRVEAPATLEFTGALQYTTVEPVVLVGRLLNTGVNTTASVLISPRGNPTIESAALTTFTLDGELPLLGAQLCVAGEGSTIFAGNVVDGALALGDLDRLPSGDYPVAVGGSNITMHVDHDGEHGWLLIGRGRNGWEFDADGQGDAATLYQDLGTTNVFTPAAYSDAVVQEILNRSGVTLDEVEIRLRRAADPQGIEYQEVRWRPLSAGTWTWEFDVNDTGYPVVSEILRGSVGGPYYVPNANTRDSGANDIRRVFTWAWGGHANQQGFSYGLAVTNGANTAESFLWENGNEQHPLPYTEVYVRSRSGAASLIKKGGGFLALEGTNSYSAITEVQEGTLVAVSGNALGGSDRGTTVAAGANLYLSNFGTYAEPEAIELAGEGAGGTLYNLGGLNSWPGSVGIVHRDIATRNAFTGGDVGEGLDLDGSFLYAVNVRGTNEVTVRDAQFLVESNVPNVRILASREVLAWQVPDFGSSPDDDGIEQVLQSIRWDDGAGFGGLLEIELQGLTPGGNYKLQLLFFEPNNANRGFKVLFDGQVISENFTAGVGANQGAALSYEFVASATNHVVALDGAGAPQGDKNPVLAALTLEQGLPVLPSRTGAAALITDGTFFLEGDVDLGASELHVSGGGELDISGAISGWGPRALQKSDTGTLYLNGANTFDGEVSIAAGSVVASSSVSLGSSLGGTRVADGAALHLDGAFGSVVVDDDLLLCGALVNDGGTNLISSQSAISGEDFSNGQVDITVSTGRLDIDAPIDLGLKSLQVDGDGDLYITGAISGYDQVLPPGLNTLDNFGPGAVTLTATGSAFQAWAEFEAGEAWLLVGRGREGWEFDDDGQGAMTNVIQNLGTTNAFAPAAYSAGLIDDLLAQSGLTMADIEVRVKRAQNVAGTEYQESRWRNFTTTDWTWVFDALPSGLPVSHEIANGLGAGFSDPTSNTRDGLVLPATAANNFERIFTWAWTGHGSQKGFAYGGAMGGVDNNSPTTFLWENGTENHAIPYTEVYIRRADTEFLTRDNRLVKQGAGTLTLTADNSYVDGTFVANGLLRVDNIGGSGTGTGTLEVASGALLAGQGQVDGPLVLYSGGTLAPGSDVGSFTAGGGMVVSAPGTASTLAIELAGNNAWDRLDAAGGLDVNDLSLDVQRVAGFSPTGNVSFTIVTAPGGVTGTFNGLAEGATVDVDGVPFTVSYTGTEVVLTHTSTNPAPGDGTVTEVSAGVYEVRFLGAAANSAFTLEFSPTLTPPNWQAVGSGSADGSGTQTLQHANAGPRGYYRTRTP